MKCTGIKSEVKMSYIQDYRMHVNAAKELVEKHGKEMVQSFFEDLFNKYPNLDMVFIYGYTPGFNDGEPCYHIQYNIIDSDEIQDYVYDYIDDLDEDIEINHKISNEQSREIDKEIDSIDGLLEEEYGTDWYILVKRNEDGSVELQDGDYDCGY
ncbi:hypothetical protein ENKO_177 [Klebsiella phage fENko-Kae01]|nr:hypothetical protein [Klebsiella phage fENko-Kae01]